jgi:hypothetical protein
MERIGSRKGVEYLLDTSDKTGNTPKVHLKFCSKNEYDQFEHGVTSEEVLRAMVDRYTCLVEKDDSIENIRTLMFLKQAYEEMTRRNYNKLKTRSRNDSSGNGPTVQGGNQTAG